MATSTRLVLRPHLRERLAAVAPQLDVELRGEVEAVLDQPDPTDVEVQRAALDRHSSRTSDIDEKQVVLSDASEDSEWTEVVTRKEGATAVEVTTTSTADEKEQEDEAVSEKPEIVPPLVDVELLDRLSRWAGNNEEKLRKSELDPQDYSYIALLAGTAAYMPRAQVRALREAEMSSEKPSPYLPAHLSSSPLPSFASEYRQLMRLLSTVLNVLFSVVGCGFAAYVAATTGGGWTRESAVLLAVFVGVVVGIADVGIVVLYKRKVKEDAVKGARLRARVMKGSGATGVLLERDSEGEIVREIEGTDTAEEDAVVIPTPKTEVRLRRRAVKET